MVSVFSFYKKLPNCLPWWLHAFVPPAEMRVPVAPFLSALGVVSVVDFVCSNRLYTGNTHFSFSQGSVDCLGGSSHMGFLAGAA